MEVINENGNSKIQWQPIIELAILMFTTLGTTIPLYLHTQSKMEKQGERTDKLYEMWCETQKEIKQIYLERK